MCVREAVQLVAHERAENDDRERIGPEFVAPESESPGGFYHAVRDADTWPRTGCCRYRPFFAKRSARARTIVLCGASTSRPHRSCARFRSSACGLTSHSTTPAKTSNKPPTPFSEIPTRKDSCRMNLGAAFHPAVTTIRAPASASFSLKCSRQSCGSGFQLRCAPHQRQIASIEEELVDVAHAIFRFRLGGFVRSCLQRRPGLLPPLKNKSRSGRSREIVSRYHRAGISPRV